MPKPTEDVQDLKRRLVLLERLSASALVCAEGVHVLEGVGEGRPRVRDAAAIVEACRAGRPPLSAVRAGLEMGGAPLAVTAGVLAAAQRDLKVIGMPHVVALVRGAPRVFRRYDGLGAAWIAARQGDLDRLSEAPGQAAAVDGWSGGLPPWFERVLEIVAIAHGDEAATVARDAAWGLAGPDGAMVSDGRDRPRGRASRRAPPGASNRAGEARDRALSFVAHGALLFDPRPRDGGALVLDRRDVERGPDRLATLRESFDGARLRLPEALALGRIGNKVPRDLPGLVADGLPIDRVERVAALGRLDELTEVRGGVEAVSAYAEWTITLVPHYASLGLALPLTPGMFEELRTARKSDLSVLALCLLKHHAKAEPDTAEQALARLDATLALFARRPDDIASILGELTGTTPGAGRALMPEIAAWLDDDALLDRHVHLSRIAGASPELSRTLRADFDRRERASREEQHLAALRSRTLVQEERLARLRAGSVAIPGPERTRRRLAERARELLARAYEVRLDAVLRRIAKETWGISVPRLTPAWRDAVRFYLAVDKNRALLATVLRTAASGADLARALPKNQAWIASVSGRFDVAAWLAPRSRDVEIAGQKYHLSVERDPIEVLRMGIPFDTCLSLEGGVNAASTVVNAADANKHVLYLRDARGGIVARQLVAVSTADAMIGYRVYVAKAEHKDAIRAAFRDLCARIAEAARLPLSPKGTPKQIHEGFWYDDGTEPFDAVAPGTPVAAYCEHLGMPVPSAADATLSEEARAFSAVQAGDVDAVFAALATGRSSWAHRRAAEWIAPRLERARLVSLADGHHEPAVEALRHTLTTSGLVSMLHLAAQIGASPCDAFVGETLRSAPITPDVAFALADAALAARRSADYFDSDGLEHASLCLVPELAPHLPIRAALGLCDRIEPLWNWIRDTQSECGPCAETALAAMVNVLTLAYARSRDPSAVIERLRGRSGLLARRVALAIAARHALHPDATGPALPPPRPQPLLPFPPASRALVELRRRAPELEHEPDYLAAVLRQAGGIPRFPPLPVPREPPFEALGDLLVQLDLAEILAPWTERDITAKTWQPGPWELFVHRRSATAVRTNLTRRAHALLTKLLTGDMRPTHEAAPRSAAAPPDDATSAAPDTPVATELHDTLAWIAALGDVPWLDRTLASITGRSARANGVRSKLVQHRAAAREIAGHIASSRAEDPLAAELARRAADRRRETPEKTDHGLVLAAMARIERHLLRPPSPAADPSAREEADERDDGDASLRLAFAIVADVDRGVALRSEIARQLVQRHQGHFGAADRTFLADWLTALDQRCETVVDPSLALPLLADSKLRPRLVAVIAAEGQWAFERIHRTLVAYAKNTCCAHSVDTLFDELVASLPTGSTRLLEALDDEPLFRRAARAILAEGDGARAIAAYAPLTDCAKQAVFLHELAASPLRSAESLRAALPTMEEEDDPSIPQLEWLTACLAGTAPLLPTEAPPRSSRLPSPKSPPPQPPSRQAAKKSGPRGDPRLDSPRRGSPLGPTLPSPDSAPPPSRRLERVARRRPSRSRP